MPVRSDTHAILDAIRQLVEALRTSSKEAEKSLGVSTAQLYVLHHLAEEEGLSMNMLAERTLTHQSSVSVVVTRLEKRGLVKRLRSKTDRRQLAIFTTPKGRRLLQRAPTPIQERLLDAIERLPNSERATLARSLVQLNTQAGFRNQSIPLFFEGKQK